jgi:hypothetical protein
MKHMPKHDIDGTRVEYPRVEPEILPPRGSAGQGSREGARFDSLFVRIEEGDDGIRRIHLKRPGPFAIAAILCGIGLLVALAFLVLSALMLLWIPILALGILITLFSGSATYYWRRIRGLFSGAR